MCHRWQTLFSKNFNFFSFNFSPKFKLYLGRVSKCICVFEQIVFVYLYMDIKIFFSSKDLKVFFWAVFDDFHLARIPPDTPNPLNQLFFEAPCIYSSSYLLRGLTYMTITRAPKTSIESVGMNVWRMIALNNIIFFYIYISNLTSKYSIALLKNIFWTSLFYI